MDAIAYSQIATLSSGQDPSGGSAPTAQQTARFEQLAQPGPAANVQFYEHPPTEASAGQWQELKTDAGHLSEQYRTDSAAVERLPERVEDALSLPSADPTHALEVYAAGMKTLTHMSYTMMGIGFLTTAERQVGDTVRTLYQMN